MQVKDMINVPWLQPGKTNSRRPPMTRSTMLSGFAVFVFFVWCWHSFAPTAYQARSEFTSFSTRVKPRYWSASQTGGLEGLATWQRPEELKKIVGLVFYGRPATVSILDCYLKRNLVKNGGMLDEIVWIVRTNNTEHLAWLGKLLETESSYARWDVNYTKNNDYRSAYDRIENGTMYIKMDDDIVFMEDSVIPTLVHSKWTNPDTFIVSANVMNQPSLSWVHYHLGAVRPYLPELDPPPASDEEDHVDWRASTLPEWSSTYDFEMSLDWKSPYYKHRWLPVRRESSDRTIDNTPIVHTAFGAFSEGLWKWTIAAQEHYSFFENLEKNELWRYKFHTWDYNYTRMGIQFVAIMGDDINAGKPLETDDEYFLTEVMTKRTGRHGIVDGRSLVAHYSFKPQLKGMATTDVLDRYRSFAEEHICPAQ